MELVVVYKGRDEDDAQTCVKLSFLLQFDFKLKTTLDKDEWTYMVILLFRKEGKEVITRKYCKTGIGIR